MGVNEFFRFNFTRPKVMSLQNGRFALRYFGKYILAVGSDRNIEDSILENRADLLSSVLKLYHNDVERISAVFQQVPVSTGTGEEHRKLIDKLYHIFETYLPLLQYNGNFLYNISILNLPKPANNVYLDTVQLLESIQQEDGVLGGQIMYHNKVISSQFSSALTHLFVISDPIRLKTVETIHVPFHVPFGVVLLNAYISSKEFSTLKRVSDKAKTVFINSNPNLLPFTVKKKSVSKEVPILGGIKRDKSLIFTNIPEDEEPGAVYNGNEIETTTSRKPKNRPNHLPLKVKNVTSKELPESGFSSINFDETDSYPDFIGKTSVCSTPMTENKVLHGNILSICAKTCEEFENIDVGTKIDPKPDEKLAQPKEERKTKKKIMGTPRRIRLPKTEVKEINTEKEPSPAKSLPPEVYKFFTNPFKLDKRRNSSSNITALIQSNGTIEDLDDSDNEESEKKVQRKRSNSINDPTFSVVNHKGDPISKDLFGEYLEYQYSSFSKENKSTSNQKKVNKLDLLQSKTQNGIKTGAISKNSHKPDSINRMDEKPGLPISKLSRKGLSLPLKSLNQPQVTDDVNGKKPFFDTSAANRGRLQLTPLMAKLTALAISDERCFNNGIGYSGDLTPLDPFPKRRPSIPRSDTVDIELPDDGKLHKVDIFVCTQQNMTMLVVLYEDSVRKQPTVQTLFDVCVSKLPKLESSLHQVLNLNVEGDKGEGSYSFMEIDNKKWGLIDKVGPWSIEDLAAVEAMHNDLKKNQTFTEITLRSDENVLYGYKSGDVQVFYQQAQSGVAGIPPPSDIMGVVGSVAKRRLERDHSIVLL